MKKKSFLSTFLAISSIAIFISFFESIILCFFEKGARLTYSLIFLLLSKIGIKFHYIYSFKKYFNLRKPLEFLYFWLQMNFVYFLFGVLLTLIIVIILWALWALSGKKFKLVNIIAAFIWSFVLSFFFGFIMRIIYFRGIVILYFLILFSVILSFGFLKVSKPRINISERFYIPLQITIGTLILLSFLTYININIHNNVKTLKVSYVNESPNIILISIDSLRYDHLGCYGYERNTTPNIDILAENGVLFMDAISTTSWTLPAHISLLTSLSPEVHQIINDNFKLSEKAILCSEILKEIGYLTAGFVSGPYLGSEFGYNQGFDLYDDFTIYYYSSKDSHRGITSPIINEQVKKWVEKYYTHPFFLFIHYWDVHYDFNPPPPYDMIFDPNYKGDITAENFEENPRINSSMPKHDLEHIIALYDGEIAFTDFYIGKFIEYLKKIGSYDKTLIILTSDHGEEFFEHGQKGHRHNLYDETLKIPLIIKFPNNQWKGNRIKSQVQIIDIVPTFLSYLSFNLKCNFQGENLMPLITDEAEKRNMSHYHFADLHGVLKCVRSTQYKYILNQGDGNNVQLFDLQRDKWEKHNIMISEDTIRENMHYKLVDWLKRSEKLAKNLERGEFEYEEDLKKILDTLGYVTP